MSFTATLLLEEFMKFSDAQIETSFLFFCVRVSATCINRRLKLHCCAFFWRPCFRSSRYLMQFNKIEENYTASFPVL